MTAIGAYRTGSTAATPNRKGEFSMKKAYGYGRVGEAAKLYQSAELIQQFQAHLQPDWSYGGMYIEVGAGHEKLNNLLAECHDNDVILIESINTLGLKREELFSTLSDLKERGVDVRFKTENLNLQGENGDDLLFVLSSFLKPPVPPKPAALPYGIGDDEEAAIVRRIFDLFLSGLGRAPIATVLNAEGILPPSRKPSSSTWTPCDVKRILADPIYIKEGVIDEETWKRATAETTRRNIAYGRRERVDSPLADLITCGVCGNHYTRRERGKSSIWLCRTYLRYSRSACPSRCIREDRLLCILSETVGETLNTVDNITIWPDGQLVISTSTTEIEKSWR